MTPDMMNELRTVSQQTVDNLVGNVFSELDKLKHDIQERPRAFGRSQRAPIGKLCGCNRVRR